MNATLIQIMKSSQSSERDLEGKRLFLKFVGIVDELILGKQASLSYQQSYDTVYKLTKQQKQTEVLTLLEVKLTEHLKRLIEQIHLKEGLTALREVLRIVSETSCRMAEICLFIDDNYCKKELNCALRKRLSNIVFKIVSVEPKVLDMVAAGVFQARRTDATECAALLKSIADIDEKEQFFERHLLGSLLPLIQNHYHREAKRSWQSLPIEEYLSWCRNELQEERGFITKHFVLKKGQEGVEAVLGVVYGECVLAYKQKIYQTDERKVFEELSLPMLELLRWGRNKEVEGHIQWFMTAIERRLNLLPLADNSEFLRVFCELYERVAVLLQSTQSKFDINYRSIFTFEEWINNEKFNIPLRLNLFMDQRLREAVTDYNRQALLVFKLVKEKALFENIYRRMLLTRLVQNYLTYRLEDELRLADAMEAECGEEWTKKIKSICGLFTKNREALLQQRNKQAPFKDEDNILLGGLWPVIVEEDNWPFESRQEKITLHPQLLQLTPAFETYYLPQNKNHRLLWSAKVGVVTLSIRFRKASHMANLLLHLEKGVSLLASYLCQSGYKIDDLEGGLQLLIDCKLVQSTAKGSDYLLQLAKDYEAGSTIDLFRGKGSSKVQVRAMEELKADRKLMVEAIIVKIMKNAKVANRNEVVHNTAPLLAQRGFNFNADFVEKSIDRLLDKQFLRDLQDGSLGYIA